MQRDVCRGWRGLNRIICESMLHVKRQAEYMEAVLQGVVGVDPVCNYCMSRLTIRCMLVSGECYLFNRAVSASSP